MGGLIKKTFESMKNEGIKKTIKRIYLYIGIHVVKVYPNMEQKTENVCVVYPPMVDVLFINGCGPTVPHPARYRVTHQREQLKANNVSSEEVYYIDLQIDQIKCANLFVFFRCPYTDTIGEFINLANKLNKTVLFDIDDLVIDTIYTNKIKYVWTMPPDDKLQYDADVKRMGNTLSLCEAAVTTTERLAEELSKYVPEVYINRNTASEKMYMLSEQAEKQSVDDEIRIGYFSGSITHNDDFKIVMPIMCRLLEKYSKLKLYLVGELDLPEDIKPYKNQIVQYPFIDWQQLPQLIASVDINIAPLEKGIFNEAKSENKWIEAALVKVPTIASNVGAFAKMIKNNETGILCDSEEEWETSIEKLIHDKNLRDKIAVNAYLFVKENCVTMYTGHKYAEFIKSKMKPSVLFAFPSTEISGGIMVALKHAAIMQKVGCNVTILAYGPSKSWLEYDGCIFPVLGYNMNSVVAYFDKAIATMWSTIPVVITHPLIGRRYYLVQGFEVDFYEPDNEYRIEASKTYNLGKGINCVTISKWCQDWLQKNYSINAKYAPNGMFTKTFWYKKREFSVEKIRILIEGDCAVDYKNVDESFRIANQLDREKFEVWYMSYNATPKDWYICDKFLHRVPYEDVANVYRECDILIKSSIIESFSYPPLEMMATGGFVVAVQNGGNSEYLIDEYNCLIYETGNEQQAINCIKRITEDVSLRKKLISGAEETVKKRDWGNIEKDILDLYDI